MRKERLELEKQGHERELELKKTEMGLAYREKLEMERLHAEKFRLQNEKELKCTEIEIHAKDSNRWDSGCIATTVYSNPSLADIDNLSYLCAQLRGKARDVIAGLEVTIASKLHCSTWPPHGKIQ